VTVQVKLQGVRSRVQHDARDVAGCGLDHDIDLSLLGVPLEEEIGAASVFTLSVQ